MGILQLFITGERGSKSAIVAIDDFSFISYSRNCPVLPEMPMTVSTTPSGPQVISQPLYKISSSLYYKNQYTYYHKPKHLSLCMTIDD